MLELLGLGPKFTFRCNVFVWLFLLWLVCLGSTDVSNPAHWPFVSSCRGSRCWKRHGRRHSHFDGYRWCNCGVRKLLTLQTMFRAGRFQNLYIQGMDFSTMVGSHLLGLEVGPSYLSSVLVGNHGPAKNDSDNRVSSTSGSKTTPISQKNVAASIPLLEYVSPKSWRV